MQNVQGYQELDQVVRSFNSQARAWSRIIVGPDPQLIVATEVALLLRCAHQFQLLVSVLADPETTQESCTVFVCVNGTAAQLQRFAQAMTDSKS